MSGKTAQKIVLFSVLTILFWSRALSSLATIQDVQSSFELPAFASEAAIPSVISEDTTVQSHLASQLQLVGEHDVRLEELSEHGQKVRKIQEFYTRWNSPMAAHAEYMVQVSEQFGLDYRLLPAISIVESSGGRFCFRSYNPFGWGKGGFANFDQAIYTVGYGLANGYRTSNPYAIAPRYNPVTPDSWASKVSSLMSQI
jgi:hypothetical protein